MQRTFIYAHLFEQDLKGRRRAVEIVEAVESELLRDLACGDVVQRTGGVRKFRSEDFTRGKERRGGIRVLYLDLPHVERTHLLFLYDKGEANDLSPEGKMRIRQIVIEIKGELK